MTLCGLALLLIIVGVALVIFGYSIGGTLVVGGILLAIVLAVIGGLPGRVR
jgi:hypothetical protein